MFLNLNAYCFRNTQTLTRELTVNDYIAGLNDNGVYVDPNLKSFITSIEPLVQSMKTESINIEDDNITIDHSEVSLFLSEIETIYNDL